MAVFTGGDGVFNNIWNGTADADQMYGKQGDDIAYGHGGNDTMFGDGSNAHKHTAPDGAWMRGNDFLDGGDGDDFMVGGNDQDVLYGGAGNDTLIGDLMVGSPGNATTVPHPIEYFPNADRLYGGSGNDRVFGNEGNDTLFGDDGADWLEGSVGDDHLDGGAGNDMLIAGDGADNVVGGEGDDTLTGGAGNDQLYGMAGFDQLYGESGDDLLVGGPGGDKTGDHLYAGDGNDRLFGADGIDRLFGGNGNDELNGGRGADYMDGGAGDDAYVVDDVGDGTIESPGGGIDQVTARVSIFLAANIENLALDAGAGAIDGAGNAFNNKIVGNGYANTLIGGEGNDQLFGMGGNDVLDGGTGLNSMAGGFGDDTYLVDDNGDTLTEVPGQGIDTVRSTMHYMLGDNVENLTLVGNASINATGNALDNTLTGNLGNNLLYGGAGADAMLGGEGNDYYVVDQAGDAVTERSGEGVDTVQTFISYALTDNVENLVLDPSPLSIDATGNALDNVLRGNVGDNRLDGKAGADAMFGQGGDDTYVVEAAEDNITELAGEGIDTVESNISYALTANVENLKLNGIANLNGTGNIENNQINGNAGNNTLNGQVGADHLEGLAGNDTYIVDDVGDVVIEGLNLGTDTVQSDITFSLTANMEALLLTGLGDINGTGNELNNTLTGNGGSNVLNGGLGNDTMRGGIGADTLLGGSGTDQLDGGTDADVMRGGAGHDSYVVDNTLDAIEENANEGSDLVRSSVSYTLAANVEHLTLTGSAAVNATGNALNNTLTGNNAQNVLTGDAGNDTLSGSGGADILLGGDGNDSFTFDALDLSIAGTRWDGGTGSDTLRFSGGGKLLDLMSLSDERAVGLEIVDLTGTGDNKLSFSANDLKALADTDTLRIDGNVGDAATIVDSGWTSGADLSFGQNLYHSFFNTGATLLIDSDVTAAFV